MSHNLCCMQKQKKGEILEEDYTERKARHEALTRRNQKLEVRSKIEKEVNQEKTEYINYAYNEELTYWEKVALARVLNES